MMGKFYGLEAAGIFAIAQQILEVQHNFVSKLIYKVYFSEIYSIGTQNTKKIKSLTSSLIKKINYYCVIPLILLVIVAPKIIDVLFSEQWAQAGHYLRPLIFIYWSRMIDPIISMLFLTYERLEILTLKNIIRIVLVFSIFFGGNYLNLTINNILLLYSILICTINILSILYSFLFMNKYLKSQ